MTHDEPIADQQLNAFIDNELDSSERARILQAVQTDTALAARLAQLQQLNDLLRLGYQHTPMPQHGMTRQQTGTRLRGWQAYAASVVLGIGITIGWLMHTQPDTAPLPLTNLAQLNVQRPGTDKILIHINDMDKHKIDSALNEAEQLLANAEQHGSNLQVEVLANADGLGVLRTDSPYAHRINQIATRHGNVAFRACGFAIQHAKLKEGHDVLLLPEAKPVDAALEEILRKLRLGWTYVRA